jgi:hypothetical protein
MSRETPNPLWDGATDDTFRKALFDYKLVATYTEKSMGGKRWLAEDIGRIRVVGLPLEESITKLREWEDGVRWYGSIGATRSTIDKKIEETKTLAEEVIHLINQTEQRPNREANRVLVDQNGHVVTRKSGFGDNNTGAPAGVYGQVEGARGGAIEVDDLAQQTNFVPFDNAQNRHVTTEGYAIKGAAGGSTALEELEKHNPVGVAVHKGGWQRKERERTRSRSPRRGQGHRHDRMRSRSNTPPGRQRSKYGRRDYEQKAVSRHSTPQLRDSWQRKRDGPLERR